MPKFDKNVLSCVCKQEVLWSIQIIHGFNGIFEKSSMPRADGNCNFWLLMPCVPWNHSPDGSECQVMNAITLVVSNSLWPHGLEPLRLPLSMGFSKHEYWSGLPCPPPRDLPNPGIKPTSLTLASRFFTTSTTWEAQEADGSEYLEETRSRTYTQNPSVMIWYLFLQQVCFL